MSAEAANEDIDRDDRPPMNISAPLCEETIVAVRASFERDPQGRPDRWGLAVCDSHELLRAQVRDREHALADVLIAMVLWGSWEDGIPEAGDDAHGSVGAKFNRALSLLGVDGSATSTKGLIGKIQNSVGRSVAVLGAKAANSRNAWWARWTCECDACVEARAEHGANPSTASNGSAADAQETREELDARVRAQICAVCGRRHDEHSSAWGLCPGDEHRGASFCETPEEAAQYTKRPEVSVAGPNRHSEDDHGAK